MTLRFKSFAKAICGLVVVSSALWLAQPSMAAGPPPDVASYRIDAVYDPVEHRITATEAAVYVNRTEHTLADLVLHLYLNAFSSEETLWMQEAGTVHRGFTYDAANPGWSRVETIALADGTPLDWEPIDADATLVRVALPAPIDPGDSVEVTIAFEAQLPRVFARTGWANTREGAGGDFVMAGQWFPKFGVWEDGSWNAYPFRANSEFYADFGVYDVAVTLPDNWRVAASGVLVGEPTVNGDGTATHTFRAEHVIDFAWSASPRFRTISGSTGDVTVTVFYTAGQRSTARRALAATLEALPLYGSWYGPYGQGLYDTLTVVAVPPEAGGAGGMEYPTLFTVGSLGGVPLPRCIRVLEMETVHELAHQWFQAMVATNEAEEPWLDEGFTDYSAARAMRRLSGGDIVACGGWTLSYTGMQRLSYLAMPTTPMAGRAWDFGMEYGIATYAKPVVAFSTLERLVGDEAMVSFLRTYVERHAFMHPSADDVRAVMAETLGEATAAWFFEGPVTTDATLDAQARLPEPGGRAAVREGGLCLPVRVKVTTAERAETLDWPCDGPLFADADPVAVEIDPERVGLLDLNLANNAVRSGTDWPTWLGALARMTQALQSLFAGGWQR